MDQYSVSLQKAVSDLSFKVVYSPKNVSDIYIESQDVNRPGLTLAGFEDYFDPDRIQFLGLTELEYLKSLPKDKSEESAERLFSKRPVAVIVTRNITCGETILRLAEKYKVPIISAPERTSECMSSTISYLAVELAPRITRHGVLVEVYGEGILILGDSGIGKSETALELINRGHRLIADDAVEIRRVSKKTLVGSAPDNIRHFIELRGVGVLNARRLFGMGAVKMTEKIEMVVQLEPWSADKVYDRLGLEDEFIEILNITVPVAVVPVKPGRNLAIIIEAAAMNHRQKMMGYNAAKELLGGLGMSDETILMQKEIETLRDF